MKLDEKLREFILNLPRDHREFKDYFVAQAENIKNFKNIVDKNQLVEEFRDSEHYNKIKKNTQELDTYLNSPYEYNCGIPKADLLGLHNYGCSGI